MADDDREPSTNPVARVFELLDTVEQLLAEVRALMTKKERDE